MGWLKQTLTGEDNQTIAIGRVIAFAITLVLLLILPVVAACNVLSGAKHGEDWRELFEALGIYVPLIVGAMTALIRVTNATEPQPGANQNGDNNHV